MVWAWEEGKREPVTLRLLDIAKRHPEVTPDAVARAPDAEQTQRRTLTMITKPSGA